MELLRLPADEAVVRRYVEELWLPYHRELEAIVEDHALAEDVDLVAEEVEFRRGWLGSANHRAWIAVDGVPEAAGSDVDLSNEGEFAGFVTTEIDEPPVVFDRPNRLQVGDIFVREPYRGTGLACDLIERAAERAQETGCAELTLDVDVGNERAIAFYENLGFETYRRQLKLPASEL